MSVFDVYHDPMMEVIDQLPFLDYLVIENNATVYGGLIREVISNTNVFTRKVDFGKIVKYLTVENGDVDMFFKYRGHGKKPDFKGIFRTLLNNDCIIYYAGLTYDGENDRNMLEEIVFDETKDFIYYDEGTYIVHVPFNDTSIKYDITFAQTVRTVDEKVIDYTVNTIRFGRHVVTNSPADTEIKFSAGFEPDADVIAHIVNRRLVFNQLNNYKNRIKILYRAKKLWMRGYRPVSVRNFREEFEQIDDIHRSGKLTIQANNPEDPYITVTKEVLFDDPVIQEIIAYLDSKLAVKSDASGSGSSSNPFSMLEVEVED